MEEFEKQERYELIIPREQKEMSAKTKGKKLLKILVLLGLSLAPLTAVIIVIARYADNRTEL